MLYESRRVTMAEFADVVALLHLRAGTIKVTDPGVVFVRVARSAELWLNVALPAFGDDDTCVLAIEERPEALRMVAAPAAPDIWRAAQYLAAGQPREAALLIGNHDKLARIDRYDFSDCPLWLVA
jgi:hypothetical protein